MDRIVIRRDHYFDSVFLMSLSARMKEQMALEAVYVLLATPANKQLLQQEGFALSESDELGPTDLLLALRGSAASVLDHAEEQLESFLAARDQRPAEPTSRSRPVGLSGGLAALPGANLALISVPGAYAAWEARQALEQGLHVMIFSNNVSVADELALKQRARDKGLLLMGPDCGTALIHGFPLGFANGVRPGPIGLVGASGTGLQEVSCQIHRQGGGISQVLGTGGRDLSAEVGGLTTLAALDMLAADPGTQVLVVVSKPPAPEVARCIVDRLRSYDKPSVVLFLGSVSRTGEGSDKEGGGDGAATPSGKVAQVAGQSAGSCRGNLVHLARYLDEAAFQACQLAAGKDPAPCFMPEPDESLDLGVIVEGFRQEQKWLHGLFCGGTLASEALSLVRQELGQVTTNLDHHRPFSKELESHTLLDLGDDSFTLGRPHPMIDPSVRSEYIKQHGAHPRTAVLLTDLVLGSGSHSDPGGALAAAVKQTRIQNPQLVVIAAVTGTELDAQGLHRQVATLQEAGIQVAQSNRSAALFAARVIKKQEERRVH